MTEGCLLCKEEENYNGEANKDFICSKCMILLGSSTQDELIKAYASATTMGNEGQAKAIKMFLTEELKDDRITPKRFSNRAGTDGVSEPGKENSTGKPKKGSKIALHKGGKKLKNVLRSRPSKLVRSEA